MNAARQAFEEEMAAFRAEDIMAVDEMGCVTGMSRAYGSAPCGERTVPLSLLKKALDSA